MSRRRLTFALLALAAGLLLLGSCLWLGGELLRPIPPTRTPAPTAPPTPLGGGGGLIAFESRRDGNSEIYVMNADGTGQRNLTNDPAQDVALAWSPDGTRIAFFRAATNSPGIFTIFPDGSGLTQLTYLVGSNSFNWSADGKSLLVEQFLQQGITYYSQWMWVTVDGSARFTSLDDSLPSNCFATRESPDATRLALLCPQGSVTTLWLASADGRAAEEVARRVIAFDWSPDGQRLALFSQGVPALSVLQLSTGEPAVLHKFADDPNAIAGLRWSPDGTRLALSLGQFDAGDLYLMWSDGSGLTRLNDLGITDAPRWSPDGNWLVYGATKVAPMPTAGVITETLSIHNLYALDVRDAFSNPAALIPVQLTTSGQDFNPQWQP